MSSLEKVKALEAAVAGIPRVAEVIAAIPAEHRVQALHAARRSYLRTTLDLGYGDAAAKKWVSAVMFRLGAELKERGSAKPRAPRDEGVRHPRSRSPPDQGGRRPRSR
jgi:hypothetical protein